MKRYLLISFALVFCIGINAQLSTNEQPVSFRLTSKKLIEMKSSLHRVTIPALDMAKIEAEDKEDEEYDMPPRFGFPHFVDYDLTNSGTWYELPNGDKLEPGMYLLTLVINGKGVEKRRMLFINR